jgi:hypothetical protein
MAGLGVAAEVFHVPAELWDRPRTGRALLSSPAIKQALSTLLNGTQSRLVIRHAPDAESVAHAEELRAWFVAHAVEPSRLSVRGNLAPKQALILEVGP